MRKILVSLLVVSMLLGLVGTAYAGGFSDTTDANVNKAAAYGWVGGYADGTFKPEGNITRAEAAKMIVNAMGLSAAASAAQGLAPKFTDVAASHWASGYINVCVAQGVLKGYADNTFKPEANITGAEIVTMIVRGLKRESEAIGDWPVGHVTVAAANNIIGTGFSANALATRVDVAKWLVKASAVTTLKLETAGWVDSTRTWLTGKFETKTGTVTAVDATNNTVTLGGTKYDLSTTYIVGGGKTLADLVGFICDGIYDPATEKINHVAIKTDLTVKTGEVAVMGTDHFYLKGDATKYTVAAIANATATTADDMLDLVIYRNGTLVFNKNATAIGTIAALDTVEFYHNASNVVTYVESDKWADENEKITAINSTTSPYSVTTITGTYYVPSTAVITLNGTAATLADIKVDMYANISVTPDTTSVATLEVGNTTVTGTVTGVRTAITSSATNYYVTVGGVEYLLATGTEAADQTTLKNSTASVTLTLDLEGSVVKFAGATSGTLYGKVTSFVEDGAGTSTPNTQWIVDIKGVATTYLVTDTLHGTLDDTIAAGDYVKIVIDPTTGMIATGTKKLSLNSVDTISSVYTGASDSLITVATGVDPDGAGTDWAAAVTTFSAPTAAVTYLNGSYSATALAKDQKVKYALDVIPSGAGVTASAKIAVVVRDTVVAYDVNDVIFPTAGVVRGLTGAVESGATVTFFTNALRTTALPITTVTTGTPAGANGVVASGSTFQVTLDLTAFTGTTVYARITDAYLNNLDVTWTVTR